MISQMLGIESDYIIIGLVAVTLIMFIMLMVNMAQISGLKKRYKVFMSGKDAKSLEDAFVEKLEQMDNLIKVSNVNAQNIDILSKKVRQTFQKVGLVKYDAFNEMGGKLSFSLALLNENEDGIILNAVHSREGCYTYMKDIIAGNAVVNLSEEEKVALERAKQNN